MMGYGMAMSAVWIPPPTGHCVVEVLLGKEFLSVSYTEAFGCLSISRIYIPAELVQNLDPSTISINVSDQMKEAKFPQDVGIDSDKETFMPH